MFKKTFFFLLSILIFILFVNFNFHSLKNLDLLFFDLNFFKKSIYFSFFLDLYTLIFFFMVTSVVSLVSLFSEFYMEHYNSKKFLFLKILFFLSMVFLVSSSNELNLMIGWDWLGISSLFLIMFYPNKLTLYNSYLTMMFNRFGDAILITIFCLFLMSVNNFIFFMNVESWVVVSLLIVCSFTKSAQYPLSSWLPAAMAAPTPISAMVHSSTLVTAGLFILGNLILYMSWMKLNIFFLSASILSFLMGGFSAKMEMDFKKMVAFSTLSQISMISFFFFLGMLVLGVWHMVMHAFFKTVLFCCCGAYFISNLSDQYHKKMSFGVSDTKLNYLLFFSVFSMSGLAFSSSFFSKDKVLEFLSMTSNSFFFVLILGSILTLIYSSKILEILKNQISFSSTKKETFLFFLVFSLVSLMLGKFFIMILNQNMLPICSMSDLILILMLFFLVFFFEGTKFYSLVGKYLTIDIFLMKSVTFSIWNRFFFLFNAKIFNSDIFIFKPHVFSVNSSANFFFEEKNSIYLFYYLIVLFFLFMG